LADYTSLVWPATRPRKTNLWRPGSPPPPRVQWGMRYGCNQALPGSPLCAELRTAVTALQTHLRKASYIHFQLRARRAFSKTFRTGRLLSVSKIYGISALLILSIRYWVSTPCMVGWELKGNHCCTKCGISALLILCQWYWVSTTLYDWFRARRELLLYKVYGISALLVLSQQWRVLTPYMASWESEGSYCCTKSMALAPFWLSTNDIECLQLHIHVYSVESQKEAIAVQSLVLLPFRLSMEHSYSLSGSQHMSCSFPVASNIESSSRSFLVCCDRNFLG